LRQIKHGRITIDFFWEDVVVFKKTVWWSVKVLIPLLGRGVLGDSLGSLRHGVLGQLTGQKQTDSGLDFSAGDGGTLVVVGQTGSLGSNTLEDIIHKGVHDAHGLAGDSSVGVNLLQHLVDVDAVRFPPLPLPLLLASSCGLGLAGRLFGSLRRCFGWHVCLMNERCE